MTDEYRDDTPDTDPRIMMLQGWPSWGEAIEHGEKQQTTDATEHMMHAIMKLSQSVGLQIPEGVATGRSATN